MLIGRKIIGTIGIMGGVPVVPTEFAKCLVDMMEYNRTQLLAQNEEIKIVWATVSTHAVARNSLVSHREGEWLFMLDTDMLFEPDTLAKLMRSMDSTNTDVMCGVYYYGSPPHLPVMYAYIDEYSRYQQLVKWDDEKPFKIGASGGGCLLVRNRVFDVIGEDPFAIVPPFTTDDFPFYDKCRVAGIVCGCDPNVKCGHLRMVAIGEEQYLEAVDGIPATKLEV